MRRDGNCAVYRGLGASRNNEFLFGVHIVRKAYIEYWVHQKPFEKNNTSNIGSPITAISENIPGACPV